MYESYINFINTQLNLQPTEWMFKNNPNYTGILEHVNYELGNKYLDIIRHKFKNVYEKHIEFFKYICNWNDKYGKTKKYSFNGFITPFNI